MSELSGQTAIVTGASRGIGEAAAKGLASMGAYVIVNHRSSVEGAEQVVQSIVESGGKAAAIQADVSQMDQASSLIKAAIELTGRLDILVNNAGTTRDRLLMQMKEDDWNTVVNTNLSGVFNCCKAAIRPMLRARQGGRIINISSVSGLVGQVGQSNYSASKAGIIGFTYALAREVSGRGITVNAVAPGYIETALTEQLDQSLKDVMLQSTPVGRFGQPVDVADAVCFLASPRASFITGIALRVDGGLATGS